MFDNQERKYGDIDYKLYSIYWKLESLFYDEIPRIKRSLFN